MRERLITIINAVAATLLAAAVVMMTMQVFLRSAFAAPFSWIEEVSRYAFVWCVYLGCIIALASDTHIRVLVLVERFGKRGQRASDMVTWIVNVLVYGYLLYWSVDLAWKYKDATFYTLPGVSQLVFYLALPVSTAIMLLWLLVPGSRKPTDHVGTPGT
jgi:C4-dicarboxylate transporter, DctQ subunit